MTLARRAVVHAAAPAEDPFYVVTTSADGESIRARATPPPCARRYRKDGALFHNTLNITPLFDADGRLLYFLGVQYDVSAPVQAESETGDLKAKLMSLTD